MIITGDCREKLKELEAESVQCCITSPPYWGLRDYGTATWEGGGAGCDHKFDHSKREAKANNFVNGDGRSTKSCTSWTTRSESEFYRDCPKCGARRIDSQLGLEAAPELYITNMVAVFREVWRVLRDDGTLWVNMGDSYASGEVGRHDSRGDTPFGAKMDGPRQYKRLKTGLKPKDLCMMPARLAMALQADGWYLRSEIVWHKPNPMPESVTDRPTKSHEMIYLLAKNGGKPLIWRARDTGEWSYNPDLSEETTRSTCPPDSWNGSRLDIGKTLIHQNGTSQDRSNRPDEESVPRWKGFDYLYDADAIREQRTSDEDANSFRGGAYVNNATFDNINGGKRRVVGNRKLPPLEGSHGTTGMDGNGMRMPEKWNNDAGRNKRSVWTVATQPYSEAHFATFPEDLIKPCILAGSRPGDTILDPFAGSGTTGKVALDLGRKAVLIELNPEYVRLADSRTFVTPGMF